MKQQETTLESQEVNTTGRDIVAPTNVQIHACTSLMYTTTHVNTHTHTLALFPGARKTRFYHSNVVPIACRQLWSMRASCIFTEYFSVLLYVSASSAYMSR